MDYKSSPKEVLKSNREARQEVREQRQELADETPVRGGHISLALQNLKGMAWSQIPMFHKILSFSPSLLLGFLFHFFSHLFY